MDIPIIEKVKIQARVLVPLIRALQAEFGEAQANAVLRRALGELYRAYGEKWWRSQASTNLGDAMASAFAAYANGDAVVYRVLRQTEDAFDADVTECGYAKFYKEIGAPELGFLLTCSADFSMTEGYGGDVQLSRTQTLMEGASHCDFRYRSKQAASGRHARASASPPGADARRADGKTLSDPERNLDYVAPVFRVADLARSLSYYRDRLGFAVEFNYAGVYASVLRDGCRLHLKRAPPDDAISVRDQAAFEAAEHLDACFGVRDVEALASSFASAGAEFSVPVRQRPYGKEFYLRDPDGHILGFVQPANAA